jgi:hypothetical protein
MIAAITGHRPDKIENLYIQEEQFRTAYAVVGAEHVIQGMAPGGDIIAAKAAYQKKIPYTAVKPWAGHRDSIKDEDWLFQYDQAWSKATEQVILNDSETYVGPWLYHNRNKWMVNNADLLIALWNGDREGGTFSTVKYSLQKKVPIYRIDPNTRESYWLP